ncbi:MAG TPA: response regulator [Acidimicrobiales bacterium]|nr:response regulator [Acidimicrobiales bacterium]
MSVVLLVDDAPDIRLLERAVLARRGHEVLEAASGREALALLNDGPLPTVVVLDVQMPEMDGWETLSSIRRHPRAADIPVILCTVKSRSQDEARAWRGGCDGYLIKPFPIARLAEEVEEVARRSPEERQAVRRLHHEQLSDIA